MFERFSDTARSAIVCAQQEAHDMRAEQITGAYLLLGLAEADRDVQRILEDEGLTVTELRSRMSREHTELDAEALAALGIDVDEVREQVEREFGPGALERPRRARGNPHWPWPSRHIPFTKEAKKCLELCLRECLNRGERAITALHVLLGVLRAVPESVRKLSGVDPEVLRRRAHQALDTRAA